MFSVMSTHGPVLCSITRLKYFWQHCGLNDVALAVLDSASRLWIFKVSPGKTKETWVCFELCEVEGWLDYKSVMGPLGDQFVIYR